MYIVHIVELRPLTPLALKASKAQGKSVREQMPAHNPNKQTIGRAFIEDQDVDRVMAKNDG